MTTHYTLEIKSAKTRFKLSYKAGKFYRLERQRGKLSDEHLAAIGRVIPPTEDKIEAFRATFSGKVVIEEIVKEKSLFTLFNEAWFTFYEDFKGIPPRFNATDGKALKSIIKYLVEISGTDAEALTVWQGILVKYPNLSDFHKDNTDLKYINSRLNIIIDAIKKASGNDADVFKNAVESDTGRNFKFK